MLFATSRPQQNIRMRNGVRKLLCGVGRVGPGRVGLDLASGICENGISSVRCCRDWLSLDASFPSSLVVG